MKLSHIKVGRWYATRLGTGECVEIKNESCGTSLPSIIIVFDGQRRHVSPRDVYGEAKKPEAAS